MFISLNVKPETREAAVVALNALRSELEAKGVPVKEGSWGYSLLVVDDPDGNQSLLQLSELDVDYILQIVEDEALCRRDLFTSIPVSVLRIWYERECRERTGACRAQCETRQAAKSRSFKREQAPGGVSCWGDCRSRRR